MPNFFRNLFRFHNSSEEPTATRSEPRQAASHQSSTPTATSSTASQSSFDSSASTRSLQEKKREMAEKNRVEQKALDIRNDSNVELLLEDLHWHSGGVFSNVYKGTLLSPMKMEVAVKKTWPKKTVRSAEMIILVAMQRARPKNIIKLLYKFTNYSTDGVMCEAFVFAYMPSTLDQVIRAGLDMTDIKIYAWQLFNGLNFLATNRIAHRDIKPVNILVNPVTGELQIGDFGSAKIIRHGTRSTAYQVTRYYRPPEMLLGSREYTHLIDVWSGGCIIGEMIKGRVLFRGDDSEHQMSLIIQAIGPPSDADLLMMRIKQGEKNIPNVTHKGIPYSLKLRVSDGRLPARLGGARLLQSAVELLEEVLVYSPGQRLTGPAFIQHHFFTDIMTQDAKRSNGQTTGDIVQPQSVETLSAFPLGRCSSLTRVNEDTQPGPVQSPV